jgi:tetratricopeptide (TPR) repeat protein
MPELTELLHRVIGDHYALERELGRGGMATVYLARDLRHDRFVAVKVVRPDLAAVLGPARFLHEIEIAAHLAHPHILPLHDSGQFEGNLYYVMPYVEGESLRARLQREVQLPLLDALTIAREVADALGYAHQHGVVHRDIKPENILLQAEHALVADFGIARAIDIAGGEELTDTGIVLGTPAYMSPEQASGDVTDGRSDLYSLGCVLYEMLAGEPPFTGASAHAVLARHRSDAPRSLRVVRTGVPPALESALSTVLAKVPADRFATAGDFRRALESDGVQVGATRRGLPRRRIAVLAAIAAALALIAVVTTFRRLPRSPSTPIGIAILPFDGTASTADSQEARSPPPHLLFGEALGWLPAVHPIDGAALLTQGRGWRAVPLPDLLRDARRLGAKYLLAGTVLETTAGPRVSVELYDVSGGERILRSDESVSGDGLDEPIGRLALASVSALATREDLTIGPGGALLSATSSAAALGHLLQGQAHFWRGDLDRAGAEFQAAIQADSGCGLAYLRLSVVQAWQFDYGTAVGSVDAALGRRDRLGQRWVNLLEAQRHLLLGSGDSAIAAFQSAVLDHRDDIDAWFGLGEALFHYGGLSGQSPQDAKPALEHVARLDSAFAPIYDHLVDLAILAGDSARARLYLGRMGPDDPVRRVRETAFTLRFDSSSARAHALNQLRSIDRQAISQIVALYLHDSFDPALADTVASFLLGADRTPDDRRRGAAFRLVALTAQGRWREAVVAWKSAAKEPDFDAWVIHADLAGFPAADLVGPMYAWAESLMRAGRAPDFTRPLWDDPQQAFHALAHRAAMTGDSGRVSDLIRRIDAAPPSPDRADPTRQAFRAALEARLALLAGDTTLAVERLRRSVSRVQEPWTWYYPLTAMAPERLLLADLLSARGVSADAKRWHASFANSWAVGDALFAAVLRGRASAPVGVSLSP